MKTSFQSSDSLNIPLRAGLLVRLEKPVWVKAPRRTVRYGRRTFKRGGGYTAAGYDTIVGIISRDSYGPGHERWDGTEAAGQHTFTVRDIHGTPHMIKGRHAYRLMEILVREDGRIAFRGEWADATQCRVSGGAKHKIQPGEDRLLKEIVHDLEVAANRRAGAAKAAATRKRNAEIAALPAKLNAILTAPEPTLLPLRAESLVAAERAEAGALVPARGTADRDGWFRMMGAEWPRLRDSMKALGYSSSQRDAAVNSAIRSWIAAGKPQAQAVA